MPGCISFQRPMCIVPLQGSSTELSTCSTIIHQNRGCSMTVFLKVAQKAVMQGAAIAFFCSSAQFQCLKHQQANASFPGGRCFAPTSYTIFGAFPQLSAQRCGRRLHGGTCMLSVRGSKMQPAPAAHITMQHPFFWPQTSSSSSVYAVSLGSNSRTYSIIDCIGTTLAVNCRDLFPMPHVHFITVLERQHRFHRHTAQGACLMAQQMGQSSVQRRVWRDSSP